MSLDKDRISKMDNFLFLLFLMDCVIVVIHSVQLRNVPLNVTLPCKMFTVDVVVIVCLFVF